MKKVKDKKGLALVTALVLSLLAMGLIAILMNLIITGTKISGSFKVYTSALEAAKGGVEYFIHSMAGFVYHKGLSTDTTAMCKVQQDTSNWPQSCQGYMQANPRITNAQDLSSHSTIDDIVNYYDSKATFGDYNVYMKLVDARGSADGNWYYTFDVVAENKNNTNERAWLIVFLRTD